MAKSAVDVFIKFKGNCTTRSLLKTPFSEFQLSLGFGPHKTLLASQIHTSSCLDNAKLDDALNMFNNMKQTRPLPSVVEFNQILGVVNKAKHYTTSLDIFKDLCSLGVSVDDHTIKAIVLSCCRLRRTNDAFAALGWNLKRAGPNIHDVFTFTELLEGLFREDRVHKAQEFFNKLIKHNLCQPDLRMYNVMIYGLCFFGRLINLKWANERVDNALKLFNEMGSISPDLFTYNAMLIGFCHVYRWREASMLLKECFDKGFSPDHQTFSTLLQFFCSKGNIYEAHLVLDMMREKDIVPDLPCHTILVKTHCLHGDMTKARYFYDLMLVRHLVPRIDTYNTLIESYCKHKLLGEAMLIYHQMSGKGLKPNKLILDTMIDSLLSAGRIGDVHKLLDDMLVQGHMLLDSESYRRILVTLCFQNRLEEALSVFHLVGDNKLNSDTLVYTNLIEGAIHCGNINVAMELFRAISVKGLKPNNYTYTRLIRALFGKGLLNDAKKLVSEMQESHCEPDDFTYLVLLRGYLQNNQYDDVAKLLHSMDRNGYNLDPVTTSLLRHAIASGSLDVTMIMLVRKLAQKQEMDVPHIAA